MAESSTQSITIHGPADAVMEVIADFAHYPEWAGSVKSLSSVDTMIIKRFLLS